MLPMCLDRTPVMTNKPINLDSKKRRSFVALLFAAGYGERWAYQDHQQWEVFMLKLRVFLLVLTVLLAPGCAWQRIPDAPEYTLEAPIPLKVGIILADNQVTTYYGPAIIKEWNVMRLFESTVYPYREGDPVNAVMRMTITGGWKGSGFGAGFVTGLTLGLAGTVVGPSLTGTHDVLGIVNKSSSEVGRYTVQVTSKVEWGLAANTAEVSKKADELQTKRMAFELAKKIRADRQNLLSITGK